jgi:hypothetical protein
MSWLAQDPPLRTLGDALALHPALRERFRGLARAVDEAGVDEALLAACRGRVRVLTGHAPASTAAAHPPPSDERTRVALEFAEQLVMDPHGVDDRLVARLRIHLPIATLVALAQGLALFEGQCRLAHALGVLPEL